MDLVLQELSEAEELEEDDSDVESAAYEGDESESGSDEDYIDLDLYDPNMNKMLFKIDVAPLCYNWIG